MAWLRVSSCAKFTFCTLTINFCFVYCVCYLSFFNENVFFPLLNENATLLQLVHFEHRMNKPASISYHFLLIPYPHFVSARSFFLHVPAAPSVPLSMLVDYYQKEIQDKDIFVILHKMAI